MFDKETISIAENLRDTISEKFVNEVKRLLNSGGVNREYYSRGLLFGVALENIAENYLVSKTTKEYKKLKRF